MDDLSTTHDSATDNRAEIVPADDATSPSTKADADAGPPAEATVAADNTVAVRRKRRILAGVTTTLAVLLVLFALVAPNQIGRLSPAAFLRIPLEGLVGVALLLVLPGRTRRVVAAIVGVALGLLTIVKIIDMGFFEVLDRPFDLVLDWVLLDDALSFLTDSIGRFGAIAAAIGLALLVVAVLVLMTLSVLRLTRPLVRHRTTAARSVAALGAVWVTCAVLGAQIVPGVPVAANSAADLAYDRTLQVRAGLRDQSAFAEEVTVDAFRDTPGDRLLTGLRGKDVIFAFVESYGRDAVEDPEMAPQVGALLDAGNQRLNAAGFASRSAFLTSPTAGGGSWLAHATLLSGLWIDNQQRHNNLLASDRLTLNGAFRRADWRTVAVMPALTQPWPEESSSATTRCTASTTSAITGRSSATPRCPTSSPCRPSNVSSGPTPTTRR